MEIKMTSNHEKEAKGHTIEKYPAFERIMHISFFIVFLFLVMVQTASLFPSIKSAVIKKDTIIGAPIGKEEYLYKEGSMVLTLLDFENYFSLKVLVNGEERAAFLGKTVNINVSDGDVVELDGTETNANTSIAVLSVSENMDEKYLGKTFIVGREVLKIFKIRLP
ncbi:MAG: hypothetical protein FIA99_10795 [Ruminiclostridium sp.]|nr:hypothetical protein [Ruminiclostridium sp.]